ncbi:hypothetical protein ACJX0J_040625, partial [Zea mays]
MAIIPFYFSSIQVILLTHISDALINSALYYLSQNIAESKFNTVMSPINPFVISFLSHAHFLILFRSGTTECVMMGFWGVFLGIIFCIGDLLNLFLYEKRFTIAYRVGIFGK